MTGTDLILIIAAVMSVGLGRAASRETDLVSSMEGLAYTIAAFVAVNAMSPAVAPTAFCILTAIWITDALAGGWKSWCAGWREGRDARRD